MDDEEEELMGANQIIDGDNKETSDLYMGDEEEELIIFDRWYVYAIHIQTLTLLTRKYILLHIYTTTSN